MTYATGRDITAEKEREAELEQAQQALRQSQKMEAVGQLTGGLAHDFNNLLASISGGLQVLKLKLQRGQYGGLERYIDIAESSVRRAASLTHRLLAFSRRQTLDPKATNVNFLIAGMEELVRRSIGPIIDLEVVSTPNLWTIKVDPLQLENALLNLCINGRDAMTPCVGKLTLTTANHLIDERLAKKRQMRCPSRDSSVSNKNVEKHSLPADCDNEQTIAATVKETGPVALLIKGRNSPARHIAR